MRRRRLGQSNLTVSEIGLGCMSLGQNQETAIRMIHAALDHGVNFLDTADLYDRGLNEEIVGAAIRHHRDEVILATKVGNRFDNDGAGWHWDASKEYILAEVKESLRRLGTDYIDLYQLHGGMIEDNIDETIEAFEQLQQEGVIRYYGISSIRPNVIRAYVEKSNMVSVMMQYSLLDRRPEEAIVELLREHSISIIARGPVAQGRLTDGGQSRIAAKEYLGQSPEELQTTLAKIQEFAREQGRSITELALLYLLHDATVASVITGASVLTQLEQNIAAAEKPALTAGEVDYLKSITNHIRYDKHR